jgi:hypothetical protein
MSTVLVRGLILQLCRFAKADRRKNMIEKDSLKKTTPLSSGHYEKIVLLVFATALFLSAFLLFSVQPMFARMVLPDLGGSPSVWAVSLCFFQGALLAGYGYAHLLDRLRDGRIVLGIHLAILLAALVTLPLAPPASVDQQSSDLYLWLVGVLLAGVGLPFVAVSANAPLLQAWFARSGHPSAHDPYFLYGASNIGSIAALIAYPVLLEPALGLSAQARLWKTGFVLLVVFVAASGLLVLSRGGRPAQSLTRAVMRGVAPVWRDRLRWAAFAFVPSGLLVAFTSYLTTDIASASFLWVLPLALFLATFIIAFSDRPVIPHAVALGVQPLAVIAGLLASGSGGWLFGLLAGFPAFFVTAMVCHRVLYLARPDRAHLTEFYMWMSLGGVLGGLFAAIVAPQVFDGIYEFPLLLLLGLACRPGLRAAVGSSSRMRDLAIALAMFAAIAVAAFALRATVVSDLIMRFSFVPIFALLGFLMIGSKTKPLLLFALGAVAGFALFAIPSALNQGWAERSFFGVLRVVTSPDGSNRSLVHGTTLHGFERLKDKDGNQLPLPVPATYYHADGPLARGVAAIRGMPRSIERSFSVGIVGLGAGSMSCHARPDEIWRFYEIDPVVVRIASDPRHFSFLARCPPAGGIVVGDARLTLRREPKGRLDYLVIDAFSSDAVPVHLITREAIDMYLERLSPDGLLALHVSNRHMDLERVAAATALSLGGTHVARVTHTPSAVSDGIPSNVVLVSRSEAAIARVLGWPDAVEVKRVEVEPWTDDYANVPGAIWRHYLGSRAP